MSTGRGTKAWNHDNGDKQRKEGGPLQAAQGALECREVQELPERVEGANIDRLDCAESAASSAAKNTEAQRKASKRSRSKGLQQRIEKAQGVR
jgi:hypothetical protein